MRELDLTTLRLFVSVCELRSIARAAEQAHIVGSAISKRLAQLEATVGTPLLQRRKHGVEPTPAALSLLEHARSMLASSDLIARDMAAFAKGLRGQVRVWASASALGESLADDVATFLRDPAHRDIQVQLEEHPSTHIVRGVQEGMASLGVCWNAIDLGALQSRAYRRDHLAVVVHPSHPLAQRRRLRFHDTLDYDQVSLPIQGAMQGLLQRAAAKHGKTSYYRVVVSSFEAALRVVRANLALSIMPREAAEPYATSYGLRVIALAEPWVQREFAICFKDAQTLSPAAELLVQHLVACAAQAQTKVLVKVKGA